MMARAQSARSRCGRICRQDAPLLAEIFRASVEELTEDDYTPAQQEAWAAAADDLEAFAERLGKQLTLIATLEGSPVGFISLDGADRDRHALCASGGGRAGRRHACSSTRWRSSRPRAARAHLSVDASDTAREFFEQRGFAPQQRNTVSVGNEWLGNTTMKKKLAAKEDSHETPDTPFPRHWLYYIVLKYVVLAAAVALALKYFGVW